MSKARDLANAGTALTTVSATELGYVDGVTSAIQTQLDAKTAKSTLTTTGDIYYASAANTPARLGIGSTDQVLKVTAGIPAWATPATPSSGLTFINRTVFTAAATTTIDGLFSDTYENYILKLSCKVSSSGSVPFIKFRYGTTTNSLGYNYGFEGAYIGGTASNVFTGNNFNEMSLEQTSAGSSSVLDLFITRPSSSGHLYANGFFNSPYKGITYSGGLQISENQAWGGIFISVPSGTVTGVLTVYGMAKS
jgi:hypothetical protein